MSLISSTLKSSLVVTEAEHSPVPYWQHGNSMNNLLQKTTESKL